MSASANIPASGAMGGSAIDHTRTIAPFLGFAALLRRAGFAVAPEQTIAWLSGIELLGPRGIDDVRRAAHATLASPPERIEEFNALFNAHFLGAVEQGQEAASEEEEPSAADDSAGGPEPIFGEETLESGAEATAAEKLAARRFAVTDDNSVLRGFARAVPGRLPRRRGYRFRSAHGGQTYDTRRMFRDAMRHAGELVNLRWRRRRMRQRRIVVLIDVSGSMKERTRAHLSFAHALTRAADSVEVFTVGTRLTRVTRALCLRDRERALTAASLLVADWDGGTRIGEAFAAFLAVPRFSALARGAAVVVLSDGLERGEPGAMRDAVEHLSRIAWRIIWLTPLAADARFEPRTAGLVAARPYLDEIGNGSSLEHICAHVLDLAKERAA